MARSKKVSKALKLRKQIVTAEKGLTNMRFKLNEYLVAMSQNERQEYYDRYNEQDAQGEDDDT